MGGRGEKVDGDRREWEGRKKKGSWITRLPLDSPAVRSVPSTE